MSCFTCPVYMVYNDKNQENESYLEGWNDAVQKTCEWMQKNGNEQLIEQYENNFWRNNHAEDDVQRLLWTYNGSRCWIQDHDTPGDNTKDPG